MDAATDFESTVGVLDAGGSAAVWEDARDKYYPLWLDKTPSLNARIIAITGTTSGTGYFTAVFAIRKDAKAIFLLNRASPKAKQALEDLQAEKARTKSVTEIISLSCDLSDFASVRESCRWVNETCQALGGLHVLCCNAGIMAFPDIRTADGYDIQMQTNFLSHALMTKLLMPSFKLALVSKNLDAIHEARVVFQTSYARDFGGRNLNAKFFSRLKKGKLGGDGPLAKGERYHQSKLAMSAFIMSLNHQIKLLTSEQVGFDVNKLKVVLAEPGVATTSLLDSSIFSQNTCSSRAARTIIRMVFPMHSAADGALSMCEAAFGKNVESGDFFYPEKKYVGKPRKAISKGELVAGMTNKEKLTLSKKNQILVWEKVEDIFGNFFEYLMVNLHEQGSPAMPIQESGSELGDFPEPKMVSV